MSREQVTEAVRAVAVRTARSVCGADDAQDCAQEALIRLMAAETVDDASKWVAVVAWRLGLTTLRARRRRIDFPALYGRAVRSHDWSHGGPEAFAWEVRDAVETLEEPHRATVEEELAGVPIREVAARVGLPVKAIRVRRARARAELRSALRR